MVSAVTRGNMSFAPKRSVSAPTGTRPSEPTSTGTATISDCSNELSESLTPSPVASGEMRFHAQNARANPIVATTRLR